MNTMNDIEILKFLLVKPSVSSVYALSIQLKDKLQREEINRLPTNHSKRDEVRVKLEVKRKANYPTILRRINSLENDGFIEVEKGVRRNGEVDARDTKRMYLSVKGITKLILDGDLSENEARLIVDDIYSRAHWGKTEIAKIPFIKDISVDGITQSFEQMRSRINLQHFKEEYVINLLVENLSENVLTEYLKVLPKVEDLRSSNKVKKKTAEKILHEFPSETVQDIFALYTYMKDQRDALNARISSLSHVIAYFRGIGYPLAANMKQRSRQKPSSQSRGFRS